MLKPKEKIIGISTVATLAGMFLLASPIEDTGVGISADDLPRIFQRFYRCDRSRSQRGIGLGLNLALAFVRAHGGDITATSTQGVGSTFTVVLSRSPYGLHPQTLGTVRELAAST